MQTSTGVFLARKKQDCTQAKYERYCKEGLNGSVLLYLSIILVYRAVITRVNRRIVYD